MLNITIDGPSGSGKSTVAKALSKQLNIPYLDTGAMYRGVAYWALQNGIDPSLESAVIPFLKGITMEIVYQSGEQNILINGTDITPFIRLNEVSMMASTVSKIPAVRIRMVELQRKIAANSDCVLDGRDTGSFVLPDANYKFYMTASTDIRAKRRYDELIARGETVEYEQVKLEMIARDAQDSSRAFAPLVIPEGAVVIDTSEMDIPAVVATVAEMICS